MSWEIKVWHEDLGDRARLSIEAGPEVPDEVISSITGSYWFEEVQFSDEEWEESEGFGTGPEGYDGGPEGSSQRLQG